MWDWPAANPESVPSEPTSRMRSSRRALAVTRLAAADTATSSDSAVWVLERTSSTTVARPCHGSSSWRTISSSWRAVAGQCTRRRSSPTT